MGIVLSGTRRCAAASSRLEPSCASEPRRRHTEPGPIQVEDRMTLPQPYMRRARARPRRRHENFGIIGVGWRAVGDADRRVLVAIADLKPDRTKHAADVTHERFADAPPHLRSPGAAVLDEGEIIVRHLMIAVKFRSHANVS